MAMEPRHIAAAVLFAATFLLLAMGRWGNRRLQRGTVALAGGVGTLLLLAPSGDLPWQAWRLVDWQVIGLLAGLMVLAGLAQVAGLFAGLRRTMVRLPPALALWSILAIAGGTSALLLNDAAVVVLVPLALPAILALGIPPVPAVVLMAVAANVGSLLTPFGNPQNAVLADAAGLRLVDFLVAQGPTVAAGFGLLGMASWRVCRRAGPPTPLGTAPVQARGRLWLCACVAGFLGAAAAGAPGVGLGGAACLAAGAAYLGLRLRTGREADGAAWRGLDWNVILLFLGLYALTAGLGAWYPPQWQVASLADPWSAGVAVTLLSNTVGNVPAVLALLGLDPAWTVSHAMFLVSVSTLGGTLLLTGSAASLLAADVARREGVDVRFWPFLRWAAPWTLPTLLLGAWATW